jgi:hypothetical protein
MAVTTSCLMMATRDRGEGCPGNFRRRRETSWNKCL